MTRAQQLLLKRLLDADRHYWRLRTRHGHDERSVRGLAIGLGKAVHPKSAQRMVDMGLAEIVQSDTESLLYLGQFDPEKPLEGE